ncbi:HalOD1 output domain-containing protein [Natrinema sp. SYSU A 869]|uniref:HalOD1 output domain-containing protein n=1 Tax=Natrinema sp. SYSU A 869 TaxID=2871694 RepID=UPI001CA3D787|nr:HalOD1 output domain-containing protein [Natrinema sp. SYSU A 869]
MDSQVSTQSSPGAQTPVSIRVVEAVAAREGIDPLEVSPPLHDVLDPTALDELFEPTGTSQRPDGTVSFTYHGHRVRVDSDGRVTLEDDPKTQRDARTQAGMESQ